MGLKAMITLDLNDATTFQRNTFYEKLKEFKWTRVGRLTTTWKCSFQDGISRNAATNEIISDIEKAKIHSKITEVEYAFQMAEVEISIGIKK
jgi:hypothetical protein